jgi:hypothetical protein
MYLLFEGPFFVWNYSREFCWLKSNRNQLQVSSYQRIREKLTSPMRFHTTSSIHGVSESAIDYFFSLKTRRKSEESYKQ